VFWFFIICIILPVVLLIRFKCVNRGRYSLDQADNGAGDGGEAVALQFLKFNFPWNTRTSQTPPHVRETPYIATPPAAEPFNPPPEDAACNAPRFPITPGAGPSNDQTHAPPHTSEEKKHRRPHHRPKGPKSSSKDSTEVKTPTGHGQAKDTTPDQANSTDAPKADASAPATPTVHDFMLVD
jgi:hypothetical protein